MVEIFLIYKNKISPKYKPYRKILQLSQLSEKKMWKWKTEK